jgi:hypothetical protein
MTVIRIAWFTFRTLRSNGTTAMAPKSYRAGQVLQCAPLQP